MYILGMGVRRHSLCTALKQGTNHVLCEKAWAIRRGMRAHRWKGRQQLAPTDASADAQRSEARSSAAMGRNKWHTGKILHSPINVEFFKLCTVAIVVTEASGSYSTGC